MALLAVPALARHTYGDDTAIVQTGLRVELQGRALRAQNSSERTDAKSEHDVFVDWNLGAFGIPRLLESSRDVALRLPEKTEKGKLPDIMGFPGLHGWGRMSQVLPVLVVGLLAVSKLKSVLGVSPGQVDMRKVAELITALTLFLVSGPAVIIINKRIMKEHHFHFPIVLASLGNVLMMVLTRTMVALGWVELQTKTMEWGRYARVVLLLNCANFATQVLGMWAYMFISVPEIQILKSITVVLVMIFAAVFVKEPINGVLVASVFVIAAGTAISAIFEHDSSRIVARPGAQAFGVVICILASTFEAAKSVCTQILMDSLKLFDGLYWSSPAFVFVAIIFVCAIELKGLIAHEFTSQLIGLLVLNAILTGFIVLSSFWFVKLVGALTLKVVTQARTVGLILVSVFFFQEHCTPMMYVGYAVSLVGIGLYDHAKGMLQAAAKKDQVLTQAISEAEKPQKEKA